MEVLVALAKKVEARNVLEIGCNTGRTAKLLLHHVPTIEVYTGIEVPLAYEPQLPFQKREITPEPGRYAQSDLRFELIIRPRGSLDLTPADLRADYDFIFIDGDHGSHAVMHDSLLADCVRRPNGIIVWHDYHDLGNVDVKPVLDGFHALGWPLLHVQGTWLVYCA